MLLEMLEMAKEELDVSSKKLLALEDEIRFMLIPKDPCLWYIYPHRAPPK